MIIEAYVIVALLTFVAGLFVIKKVDEDYVRVKHIFYITFLSVVPVVNLVTLAMLMSHTVEKMGLMNKKLF